MKEVIRKEILYDLRKTIEILEKKEEKEEKSESAVAAAILHSEYFKSRVQNSTQNNSSWKNKLD